MQRFNIWKIIKFQKWMRNTAPKLNRWVRVLLLFETTRNRIWFETFFFISIDQRIKAECLHWFGHWWPECGGRLLQKDPPKLHNHLSDSGRANSRLRSRARQKEWHHDQIPLQGRPLARRDRCKQNCDQSKLNPVYHTHLEPFI